MGRITCRITVTGKVQGVSFRAFVQQRALLEGVDGWVRNKDDCSVEALLQGEEEAVKSLIESAKAGPHRARVKEVSVEMLDGNPRQDGFHIAF